MGRRKKVKKRKVSEGGMTYDIRKGRLLKGDLHHQ